MDGGMPGKFQCSYGMNPIGSPNYGLETLSPIVYQAMPPNYGLGTLSPIVYQAMAPNYGLWTLHSMS
jgi:hypothetical protein